MFFVKYTEIIIKFAISKRCNLGTTSQNALIFDLDMRVAMEIRLGKKKKKYFNDVSTDCAVSIAHVRPRGKD